MCYVSHFLELSYCTVLICFGSHVLQFSSFTVFHSLQFSSFTVITLYGFYVYISNIMDLLSYSSHVLQFSCFRDLQLDSFHALQFSCSHLCNILLHSQCHISGFSVHTCSEHIKFHLGT